MLAESDLGFAAAFLLGLVGSGHCVGMCGGIGTALTFTVTLDTAVDTAVSVDFGTINGTATTGDNDYAANSGTLNFAGTAGETETVTINVNGDDRDDVAFFGRDRQFKEVECLLLATGANAPARGAARTRTLFPLDLSGKDTEIDARGAPFGTTDLKRAQSRR